MWQFVPNVSEYMRTYIKVPGYDAYFLFSFALYEGHIDNLQQL